MPFKPYSYQLDAINHLDSGKILCGGVGTGKSVTSIAFFLKNICNGTESETSGGYINYFPSKRSDLYIITTARKRDTKEWDHDLGLLNLFVGENPRMKNIFVTVDSWNNIHKYTDVENAFFIFDEQRIVGSGSWVKSFYAISKKNQWILLSATPGDTWEDYIPVFVANKFFKNKTDMTRQHAIYNRFTKFPMISRWIGEKKLTYLRDSILVPMNMEKKTHRITEMVTVDYDKDKYKQIIRDRWNIFESKPIENIAQLNICVRKLVNDDISRYRAALDIVNSTKRIIIFYNLNSELDILRNLATDSGKILAEYNGHRHDPLPKSDEWVYLVQYTAGAEGWNCTTTDSMMFYSLNYSYKIFEQAKGRIDRINTPYIDLKYYILSSKSPLDLAIKRSLDMKRDFQPRKLFGKEK